MTETVPILTVGDLKSELSRWSDDKPVTFYSPLKAQEFKFYRYRVLVQNAVSGKLVAMLDQKPVRSLFVFPLAHPVRIQPPWSFSPSRVKSSLPFL